MAIQELLSMRSTRSQRPVYDELSCMVSTDMDVDGEEDCPQNAAPADTSQDASDSGFDYSSLSQILALKFVICFAIFMIIYFYTNL